MCIKSFTQTKTAAILAIGTLLGIVGNSNAQQNSLTFPWQSQSRSQGAVYRDATNDELPEAQYQGAQYQSAQSQGPLITDNSRSFYPGTANSDRVSIDVRIPATAKITFEGAKTTQTGERRHFVSPSIAEGYQYTYHVNATWMENGREVNRSKSFTVQAGDVIHLTFTHDDVKVRSEQ